MITPDPHPSIAENSQGPSPIRSPDWPPGLQHSRVALSSDGIDLRRDRMDWEASEPELVLRPERDWENAVAPVEPSVRSMAYEQVN